MNPIEICRAGTHTDSHGTTLNFSESDVAAMAAAYDPALSEAPIVVGHPKADAPAWGWIKSLTAQAGRLYALPDQVDPAFAEMVRAGRYKKLSAALYGPTSPANPKPGAWYLRHVGFLGAQPPAVKGLAPVCFASGDDGYITVEFSEELSFIARLVGLLRGLRDYITEKDGAEKLFELEWLLNRAFAMRRKTLSNNLRAAGISDERLKSLLGACGIEGNIRAEKLTVAQFANIAREIEAHGK